MLSRMPHDKITAGVRKLCQLQTSALVQVRGRGGREGGKEGGREGGRKRRKQGEREGEGRERRREGGNGRMKRHLSSTRSVTSLSLSLSLLPFLPTSPPPPPSPQLTQGTHLIRPGTSTDPALWMDRLTAIFRSCSVEVSNGQPHPCQPVVEEVRTLIC